MVIAYMYVHTYIDAYSIKTDEKKIPTIDYDNGNPKHKHNNEQIVHVR